MQEGTGCESAVCTELKGLKLQQLNKPNLHACAFNIKVQTTSSNQTQAVA
jgi:hypothetical protein